MSMNIGPISTLDEMEFKVLKFQHEKLKQRFEYRKKAESDLKLKIEQLEKRKMEDEAVINIVNRHWNQLDEDFRIILQKFDGMMSNELEIENDMEATSFLSSEREELDGKLKNRVMVSKRAVVKIVNAFDHLRLRNEKLVKLMKSGLPTGLEDRNTVKNSYIEVQEENNRLHSLNTALHEKCHFKSLKVKELKDKVFVAETKSDELKNELEEVLWDKCKLQMRYDKSCARNTEQEQNFRRLEASYAHMSKTESNGNQKNVDMMDSEQYKKLQKELEDIKEVSNNRLEELEKLHAVQKETLMEVEKLKMGLKQIPDEFVTQTPAFKCLQSKFSVIFNNTIQIIARFDEFKEMFSNLKTQHLKDIDRMERDELTLQIKMKTEILTIEDALDKTRKMYEKAHANTSNYMADTDMLTEINREMKKLVTSLQNNNKRLRVDAQRFKKKYTEMKQKYCPHVPKVNGCKDIEESPTSSCYVTEAQNGIPSLKRPAMDFSPAEEFALDPKRRKTSTALVQVKEEVTEASDTGYPAKDDKWDQHRRDKEKKRGSDSQKMVYDIKFGGEEDEEDVARLIKELEKDMDVTGQAYEEMLEHNRKLISEILTKDRENLRLIGENVKQRDLRNSVRLESQLLTEQIDTLTNQLHNQQDIIRLLSDKEAFLMKEVSLYEKEAHLRQTAMDSQKRKLVESVQIATDLKIHLEKYQSQMKDAQETIMEKTSSLESEKYKIKRLQEELAFQKKAIERLEKIESAGSKDVVMVEEIREYKELLTCNACQIRRKNAVLTKCFHVFCFDCLRTRYDTRQRKCPKCNAAFGAKDYHRLFLN